MRRGPRRQVLDLLAQPLERLKWLKGAWTVTSRVYVEAADRQPGSTVWQRPRQPQEYPENDAAAWAVLAEQAGAAAVELDQLRAYAAARHRELTNPTG